jgi:hypothetical protein
VALLQRPKDFVYARSAAPAIFGALRNLYFFQLEDAFVHIIFSRRKLWKLIQQHRCGGLQGASAYEPQGVGAAFLSGIVIGSPRPLRRKVSSGSKILEIS